MNQFSYLEGIAERRLLLQRCARCGTVKMLRPWVLVRTSNPMCPECHSLEWETFEASGRATVASYIINVRSPAEPKPIFAMVELDEGPCFYSTIIGTPPDGVENDMAVEAVFTDEDDAVVLQFQPVR